MLSVSIGGGNLYSGDIAGGFNTSFYKSHKLCDSSLHWGQITDIKARAPSDSMVSGIGF